MSLQDDLTAVQRNLDDLERSVGQLERRVGGGLDIRRVRSDTDRLRESLQLLREGAAGPSRARPAGGGSAPVPGPEMVTIPDTPYDTALWAGAEDEGLGALGRRAP
ncbi:MULTISPECIES: hypothetical protein [Actinomycetes]|uniref:Uncharacterized protein n=2 Tax=Streptomyces rimosus subsp. rimosus TaxID=132474 RepID=L8ER25_STRR1|nr:MULTISPECIES: hypothetical protein [Streptomyces]KOG79035.1 hypothetical protein ADK78_06335 [Kitasatospora aureofaciens]MYT47491.1 hypothetical protein [Streptomyces sp. SID5471]KEF04314.1 hypothetical protein DF17_23855 [Streptomyces rimosus]KEF17709.1 hypothetical protein DF18_28150 [Streptomyces rimosus]KOT40958.1 hypothetical protein ADK42_12395 [Streptomyces rimosus subsp. rimosus]